MSEEQASKVRCRCDLSHASEAAEKILALRPYVGRAEPPLGM